MTPQERWWRFRERLPALRRRERWGLGCLLSLLLAAFALCLLPYLLPLSGEAHSPDSLMDADGAFLNLEGRRVYYQQQGQTGEAVLLVHGFGGASITWQDTLPALAAAGYRAYAIDLLGFGLSEKGLHLEMQHQAQAEMLAAFMESQQIERAHLVGHSLGGSVVLHFAMRYPSKTQSLTLLAPSLQYEASPTLPSVLLDTPFLQRWARVLLRWMLPQTVALELESAAEVDERISATHVAAHQRVYQTPDWDLALLALARDNHLNALPMPLEQVETPVLIVWGAADSWIPVQEGVKLAAAFPDASYVELEGLGHLPMLEAPERFNRPLLRFLGQN